MKKLFSKYLLFLFFLVLLFTFFVPVGVRGNVFKISSTSFYIGFIDLGGVIHNYSFLDLPFSFSDEKQQVQGELGQRLSRLAMFNHTDTESWVVNIAPEHFESEWEDGEKSFKYNGGESEGRLEVDPLNSSVVYSDVNCFNTNFSKGSETVFVEGDVDSVDLIVSSGVGFTFCRWYLERVVFTQHIPAGQEGGNYSFGMVVSIQ